MSPEQAHGDPATRKLLDQIVREYGQSGRTFKSALIFAVARERRRPPRRGAEAARLGGHPGRRRDGQAARRGPAAATRRRRQEGGPRPQGGGLADLQAPLPAGAGQRPPGHRPGAGQFQRGGLAGGTVRQPAPRAGRDHRRGRAEQADQGVAPREQGVDDQGGAGRLLLVAVAAPAAEPQRRPPHDRRRGQPEAHRLRGEGRRRRYDPFIFEPEPAGRGGHRAIGRDGHPPRRGRAGSEGASSPDPPRGPTLDGVRLRPGESATFTATCFDQHGRAMPEPGRLLVGDGRRDRRDGDASLADGRRARLPRSQAKSRVPEGLAEVRVEAERSARRPPPPQGFAGRVGAAPEVDELLHEGPLVAGRDAGPEAGGPLRVRARRSHRTRLKAEATRTAAPRSWACRRTWRSAEGATLGPFGGDPGREDSFRRVGSAHLFQGLVGDTHPTGLEGSRVWHRLAGTGTGPAQPAGCAAARWIASTCVG